MSFFWNLTCSVPLDDVEKFVEVLDLHLSSIGWFETENPDVWMIEGTTRYALNLELLQSLVAQVAKEHHIPIPQIHLEKRPDADWLAQTWKNFPPLEIADFYIYGSHAKGEIPKNLIGMEMNAATAFGSGEHETTTGCLQALCHFKKDGLQVQTSLDMGCGSGVLSIAIAKLWHVPVLAIDNDPECVRITEQNVLMNQCALFVHALCNEGFEEGICQQYGPFDLIVANILAGPLCDMAPDMIAHMAQEGRIILSGLLTRQVEEVRAAYEAVGAALEGTEKRGDWVTLKFKRVSTG